MLKLTQYIKEKLIINKNFMPYNTNDLWKIKIDEPGYVMFYYKEDDISILKDMFEQIYKRPPLHNSIAENRFMSNDEPILTKWTDLEGRIHYVVFGYDKKRFKGRFAMWFIDYSNNDKVDDKIYMNVAYSNRLGGSTFEMIREHNCYMMNREELEYVLNFYDTIYQNNKK